MLTKHLTHTQLPGLTSLDHMYLLQGNAIIGSACFTVHDKASTCSVCLTVHDKVNLSNA
jgi:hypothetical protein